LDSPRLVLDTNIIIDYLRRREETLRAALLKYNCAITAITLYELRAGIDQSARQEQLLDRLVETLLVLPFGEDSANMAASIWRTLKQRGEPIGLPDTLIAGTCLAHNLPILTGNLKHYQRVPGLIVIAPAQVI
jgi:predicted nucleic acid-binding protein